MSEINFSVKSFYDSIVNKQDVFTNLEAFVAHAEEYNSDQSKPDVVKEYIQLSGSCDELKELTKMLLNASPKDVIILLKALTCILARIASDLNTHSVLGFALVMETLNHGVKPMNNVVRLGQKQSRIKAVLNLIASMIAQGPQAASSVFAKMNLAGPNFLPLLGRSNPKDEEDIRSSYINVVLLLFVFGDNTLIRQIMETKGFLNSMFPGLPFDRASLITFFLETLYTKVVNNNSISKTSKIRVLNDYTLKYVLRLYVWSGPTIMKQGMKRKMGDDGEPLQMEADDDDIKAVHSIAHKFMTALCCSYKTGIIFRDPTYGTSGRNPNHIVTNILASFPNPHSNDLLAEFVVAVLKTCPDQIKYYLPSLKDSLVPRFSVPWLQAIDLLIKIVKSQDYVSYIFKSDEKKPLPKMLAIAKAICVPTVINPYQIVDAFKNSPSHVCYKLLEYIGSIMDQADVILNYCDSLHRPGSVLESDLKEFRKEFVGIISAALPDVKHLQNYWYMLTSCKQNAAGETEIPYDTLEGYSEPTYFEQLCRVLDVLKHFCILHHGTSGNVDATFYYLFGGLKSCKQHLTHNEVCALHLKLIDIFSYQDFIRTSDWSESLGMPPLAFVIDLFLTVEGYGVSTQVLKLVHQLLKSCQSFYGEQWETDIWMKVLKMCDKTDQVQIIDFLNEVVQRFDGLPNESSGEKESTACEFSSILLAALFVLDSCSEPESEKMQVCKSYVQSCLKFIIHHQKEPKFLFNFLKKFKHLFSPHIFQYWKYLCCPQKTEVEMFLSDDNEDLVKVKICELLQEAFLSFHSKSMDHDFKKYLKKLGKKFQSLNRDEIPWVTWQILSYINLEVEKVQDDVDFPTAIVYYIDLLKNVVTNSKESVGNDTDDTDDVTKNIMSFSRECLGEVIIRDILSHPSVLKCFLFMLAGSEKVPVIDSSVEVVTAFIFDVLHSDRNLPNLEHFSKVLTPLKNKAIDFCKMNIGSQFNSVAQKDFVFSAFKKVTESFVFAFEPSDKVILLEQILSVDENILNKFDSECNVLFSLLETYLEEKQYALLPSVVVKELFKRFAKMKRKTKQKTIMKEKLKKLLEKHPIYALDVDTDDIQSLLNQKSKSCLKIFEILISCNPSACSSVKHAITSMVNLPEDQDHHFLSHLIVQCLDKKPFDEDDLQFLDSVSSFMWKYVSKIIAEIGSDSEYPLCKISNLLHLMMEKQLLSEKKMNKLMVKLRKTSEETIPSISKTQFLVDVICCWKNCSLLSEVKPCTTLVLISLNWLSMVSLKVKLEDIVKFKPLLDISCAALANAESELLQESLANDSSWLSRVQSILKVALRSSVGPRLLEVLNCVCKKLYSPTSDEKKNDIKNIHALVVSHSNFFNIMLNETDEHSKMKEQVAEFLVTLIQLGNVCQDVHVPLLLASYKGTMSSTDQKLLYLLKVYEEKGIDMSQFSPFLWSTPAITHYSVRKNVKLFLWKQPRMQEILRLFDKEILRNTSVNFPLNLKLEPVPVIASEIMEYNVETVDFVKIYDPRFALPLLSKLLSPGSYVNCKDFIESNMLSIVFGSLTSYDPQMRALGYYCLSQFYSHLESDPHGQKKIWISILDTVQNSIDTINPRLPSVISLFLTRAFNILTRPGNQMYNAIFKFLMVKPNLNLNQIPEFYKLFNSNEIEFRLQRNWILSLLEDGLRSSLDFHLCQKIYLFTILLPYYSSCFCTETEKVKILKILERVALIYSSARTLCQTGLLPWLHSAIKSCGEGMILKGIVNVAYFLWKTSNSPDALAKRSKVNIEPSSSVCEEDPNDMDTTSDEVKTTAPKHAPLFEGEIAIERRSFHSSFAAEFSLLCLSLLEKLDLMDTGVLFKYLHTFNSVLKQVASTSKGRKGNISDYAHLSYFHASVIHQKWVSYSGHSSTCSVDLSSTTLELPLSIVRSETMHELFGEILVHWHPKWNAFENIYRTEVTLCIDIMQSMLHHLQGDERMLGLCSEWFLLCLESDRRNGLSQTLLSSNKHSGACLEKILILREKQLSLSKVDSSSDWKHIVDKLKDVSHATADCNVELFKILFSR